MPVPTHDWSPRTIGAEYPRLHRRGGFSPWVPSSSWGKTREVGWLNRRRRPAGREAAGKRLPRPGETTAGREENITHQADAQSIRLVRSRQQSRRNTQGTQTNAIGMRLTADQPVIGASNACRFASCFFVATATAISRLRDHSVGDLRPMAGNTVIVAPWMRMIVVMKGGQKPTSQHIGDQRDTRRPKIHGRREVRGREIQGREVRGREIQDGTGKHERSLTFRRNERSNGSTTPPRIGGYQLFGKFFFAVDRTNLYDLQVS